MLNLDKKQLTQFKKALDRTFIVVLKYTNHFNERSSIFKKSIQSLITSIEDTNAKIVLIDNGENDEEEYCLDLFHTAKLGAYLRLHNPGLVARNIGFDVGTQIVPKAQFVVFADDDLIFTKGWLEECLSILIKHPDKKITASPIHTSCHLRNRRLNVGKLPDGNILNKRSGPNCRVFRIKDFLKIGRFSKPRPGDFPANGVEYTNRFNKLKYLSAMTLKPMAIDLCARSRRHAYPGQKGKAVVDILKKYNESYKKVLTIGADRQKVQNKLVYAEIGSFILYSFPEVFLYWLNTTNSPSNLINKLYKERVQILHKNNSILNNSFDAVFIDSTKLDTLIELKKTINLYLPKIRKGGVLVCYLDRAIRNKFFKNLEEFNFKSKAKGALLWKVIE